jgi:O-antigen/teichoic acid export membrane protein
VFVGAGTNLALNAVLIPQYGATGAAWATVAAEVAVCLYQTVKTYAQQPYGRYLKDSMPFMLSAAVMGVAVYLLRGVVSETVPGMALLVLSGVAVYLLLFAVSLKLTGKSLKDSILLK